MGYCPEATKRRNAERPLATVRLMDGPKNTGAPPPATAYEESPEPATTVRFVAAAGATDCPLVLLPHATRRPSRRNAITLNPPQTIPVMFVAPVGGVRFPEYWKDRLPHVITRPSLLKAAQCP